MPVAGQQSIPRRLRRDGRDDARARVVDVASRTAGGLAAVDALGSGVMLANKHIMFVAWGPEPAFLYNDACRPVFGQKSASL